MPKREFIRWWNDLGYGMGVTSVNPLRRRIVLSSERAGMRLVITRRDPLGDWRVIWRVDSGAQWNIGRVMLSHNEIRCAFGLEDEIANLDTKDINKQWLAKHHAKTGVIGKFIRADNRLNIPGPNSNFEPKRAVSVLVNHEMRRLFLDTRENDAAKVAW
ncbi:MAG: hypothetical protein RIQ56_43 [Candidatus Parcubacteria bacterium]